MICSYCAKGLAMSKEHCAGTGQQSLTETTGGGLNKCNILCSHVLHLDRINKSSAAQNCRFLLPRICQSGQP